jgi:hypothetical protein
MRGDWGSLCFVSRQTDRRIGIRLEGETVEIQRSFLLHIDEKTAALPLIASDCVHDSMEEKGERSNDRGGKRKVPLDFADP